MRQVDKRIISELMPIMLGMEEQGIPELTKCNSYGQWYYEKNIKGMYVQWTNFAYKDRPLILLDAHKFLRSKVFMWAGLYRELWIDDNIYGYSKRFREGKGGYWADLDRGGNVICEGWDYRR